MIEVQCEFILKVKDVENKTFDFFKKVPLFELKWTGKEVSYISD